MPNLALLVIVLSYWLMFPSVVNASSSNALLLKGQVALANGQVNSAISILQQAQKQSSNHLAKGYVSVALAEAQLYAGQLEESKTELDSAYQTAKNSLSKGLIGQIALRYGHVYAAKGNAEKAQAWYRQALSHAEVVHSPALAAASLINLAKHTKRFDELTQAQQHIAKLPTTDDKNTLLLALGYQASQQKQLRLAQQSLQAVLNNTQNTRQKAQAIGLLGHLYEQQQRTAEALQLTEQALITDRTPDLHAQWAWQRARLLEKSGDNTTALSAYRLAVRELQSFRLDIPVVYQDDESSFKRTFAPIYLSYIDLLLQQAAKSVNKEIEQSLLNEAMQTWEQLKRVELQDYFKDFCAVKQRTETAKLDSHTAMLYPIILADHLVLLLHTAEGIKAYRVEHTPAEIKKTVTSLSDQLASIDNFSDMQLEQIATALDIPIANIGDLTDHKTLYQWLIAPLKTELEQSQIDTLVYLPDGPLRKIPFSLLHDGKQFLVEQYALVTVPGLSMLSSPSDGQSREDILLAGMSERGPVIDEFLVSGNSVDPSAENREVNDSPQNLGSVKRNIRASQLTAALALPGVTEELKTLAHLTDQPVLENTGFLLDSFKRAVNQGHFAVHIASHGFFSGDPKKSFIMAYDHLITMPQLNEIFQTEAFHDHPIELVTLSACKTAEGDDRSTLGLSGVVVKTGVKSAIGTLWPVDDRVPKQFFADFYKQYLQPGMTKAKAMQYAQKQMLNHKGTLSHPAYWASFVLVGEWH